MPSDQSTWLIAVPNDGDAEGLGQELRSKLSKSCALAQLDIPSFKVSLLIAWSDAPVEVHGPYQTGTLDLLVSLSEDLPKQEAYFTATVAKTVDTLRSLLNNDPAKLAQHILVDEKTVDDYLLKGWKWNEGRYGVQKSLREITDTLNKVGCVFQLF